MGPFPGDKAVGLPRPVYLRTSDIARTTGIHVNTVRLYERWGLLPPVPRSAGGYRQFTTRHLEQVRLIRIAFRFNWLGGEIRQAIFATINLAAAARLPEALATAQQCLQLVRAERERAEKAAEELQRWSVASTTATSTATSTAASTTTTCFSISEAAHLLAVTPDMLRNWERNGLVAVPRNKANRYRCYSQQEIGRLRIIRTLRRARYSLMSILRTLQLLDQQAIIDVKQMLDTPAPAEDDDIEYVFDRCLTALAAAETAAQGLISQVQAIMSMTPQ